MLIQIEMVDQATSEVFATTEAPLESLPQSFERMETTLNIGTKDYAVVSATPSTREAIGREGRVRMILRLVEKVDPKSVLYSMPTLSDALPAVGQVPAGQDVALRISEDDYRQIEFVHASVLPDVDAELASIRAILKDARQGSGFSSIHLRKRVPLPLESAALELRQVEDAMKGKGRLFGFRQQKTMVLGGFAYPSANALLYGIASEGKVSTLAVRGFAGDFTESLYALAESHGLVLVDYCRAERRVPLDGAFSV